MKYNQLIVAKKELAIVNELIRPIKESNNLMNNCITKLKTELKNAKVVDDETDIPLDVIRLESIVDVKTTFGIMKIQLVLPENSNSEQKRISILTPMGSALFGYAESDKIAWEFPNGVQEVEIIKVSQSS
ncbi:MAG TPA: GreA/GreB family elongation factor [Fluviicola sp.]|nr:GreA/GreB family elongation factor [Fluviicola sp.]